MGKRSEQVEVNIAMQQSLIICVLILPDGHHDTGNRNCYVCKASAEAAAQMFENTYYGLSLGAFFGKNLCLPFTQ